MQDTAPPLDNLMATVRDATQPIGMRMRAAYYLRTAHANCAANQSQEEKKDADSDTNAMQAAIVQALADGLRDTRHGSLMRHEFAYVLGQLRDVRACAVLAYILQNDKDNVMVRHEAAEALGAIGAEEESKPVLQCVLEQNAELPELAETCQIALDVMAWRKAGAAHADMPAACACMLNPYSSVDPAPPHPAHADLEMSELGDMLLDASLPMFARYRAMFSMRNRGGTEAVRQLCRALTDDTSSALLRHEVAYVLGQMQDCAAVDALEISLRRTNEHDMVRHESAEALGAMEGRWSDVERILQEFQNDPSDVVRESCIVALDAADYWGHNINSEENGENKTDDDGEVAATAANFSTVKATSGSSSKPNHILTNHFNVVS